jgi:hypothetical protein
VTDTINLLLGAFMGICCMIAFALINASPGTPGAPKAKGDAGFVFFGASGGG